MTLRELSPKQHPGKPKWHIVQLGDAAIDFVRRWWVKAPKLGHTEDLGFGVARVLRV